MIKSRGWGGRRVLLFLIDLYFTTMGKFDNSKKHVTKQKKHPKLVRLWVRAKFLSFRR